MLRSALGLALLSIALVGCQDEYEEECSAFCPEGPSACPQGEVDCTKNCAEIARSAEEYGCRPESVAYSKCVAAEDVCAQEAPPACTDEYGAFYSCLEAQGGQ